MRTISNWLFVMKLGVMWGFAGRHAGWGDVEVCLGPSRSIHDLRPSDHDPMFWLVSIIEVAGELELLIETAADLMGCPVCGPVVTAKDHHKDHHPVWVRDLPIAGRPVVNCWHRSGAAHTGWVRSGRGPSGMK